MAKFRKKPIVIEAIKWYGNNENELFTLGTDWRIDRGVLYISTLEGNMKADIGDYIIKGVNGELYPCKPDIFEKTYDMVGVYEPITE